MAGPAHLHFPAPIRVKAYASVLVLDSKVLHLEVPKALWQDKPASALSISNLGFSWRRLRTQLVWCCGNCQVHETLTALQKDPKNKIGSITFTGHSLGAALATLAAYDIAQDSSCRWVAHDALCCKICRL